MVGVLNSLWAIIKLLMESKIKLKIIEGKVYNTYFPAISEISYSTEKYINISVNFIIYNS